MVNYSKKVEEILHLSDSVEIDQIKALSEIERALLINLTEKFIDLDDAANLSKLPIDSARRASAWLAEKKYMNLKENDKETFLLTLEGKKIVKNDFAENIMIKYLEENGDSSFNQLQSNANLTNQEFTVALGINKKKAFISISNGIISLTGVHKEIKQTISKELLSLLTSKSNLTDEEKQLVNEFLKRGLIEKKIISSKEISLTKNGLVAKEFLLKNKVERVYDLEGEVPRIFMGKKAPYLQFLSQIRSKLVALGFNEMPTPLVVSEFYNFDVLFQPQNHPARTWSDTYQLTRPTVSKLPDKKIIDSIRAAHENGGKANSKGWGYKWDENIAKKLMPAAQGTAHSAKTMINDKEMPKKHFAIARVFRPDVLDATHLIEFNQMEGYIVGQDLNFRNLLGMLKEFAIEIAGAEKVKFFPDYYPFTEPSVQLSAKHPDLGWVELGGAGMFRPEILKNIGIDGQAIAWGFGIDRLAMFKLGIKDIRYLFAEDLGYLRKAPAVMLDDVRSYLCQH
ncbi:MAG: phenylalanine--tRNA ligase subunit alpha [Candidatus ainarchaeum sp.]|nr:phenylalanine--tRNA ligase subunit alpha [Candidatus ainarchaeum sp.]